MSAFYLIDPATKVDYGIDWTDWLTAGDTITTSVWEISPAGPTLSAGSMTSTSTAIFIEGCAVGKIYRLTNRISTVQARTDERSIVLRCEER